MYKFIKIGRIVLFAFLFVFTLRAQVKDIVHGNLIQFNENGAWCWYQDERAIIDTVEGKLIIGSVASDNGVGGSPRDGLIEAVIMDLKNMSLKKYTLMDNYCDDHNAPAFLICPDGRYITFYALHNSEKLSYYRIFDGENWGSQEVFNWNTERPGGVNYNTTYSNLFYLSSEGRMFNFARGHDNGSPNFMYSTDGGTNWDYGGQLARSNISGYSRGYFKYWGNGIDRIDFICTETHPRNYNTSIYHGYVKGGKTYDSYGNEVDSDIYNSSNIPVIENSFTVVFPDNTKIGDDYMRKIWDADLVRYKDGTIAAILTCRINNAVNGNDESIDPDHAFIYCRFNGVSWSYTYLGQAGKKMYSSEADYTGLGALHPNDPNIIYISTHIDPRNNENLNRREIFKGVTTDNGLSWTWTPITENSTMDNFRPIIPSWKNGKTALLWFRGTYLSAQNYDAAIVGIIEGEDSIGLMNYVDATEGNTFRADGSTLGATGPDANQGPVDNNWHWRTGYGNGEMVLTSAEAGGEDAPLIKTQIIAPMDGIYHIWVNFWANPNADWRIKAGLSNQNMQIYRHMASKKVDEGAHTTQIQLEGSGNTFLYQAYLGKIELLSGDTIEVFVDDEAIQTGTTGPRVGDVCRTWYDGVSYFVEDLSGILDVVKNDDVNCDFKLDQNYPNPFNEITTISYSLYRDSYVILKVFNLLGEEIATLINEDVKAGSYKVSWDSKNLPSGIYFYKMTIGNVSKVKKMTLLK
ncbi:MAG: BNR-4 repeat-containing protein [candidate division WOR-3 bacterium]